MTEVTKTGVTKYSAGNLIGVYADLTNVIASYTLTVPHLTTIVKWGFSPTTEADWGATVSGNVLTFATSTTIAGKIWAEGR